MHLQLWTVGLTASADERTVTGVVLPYGQEGRTNLGRVKAVRGALTLAPTILANLGHDRNVPVGVAARVEDSSDALRMTFSVARVPAGDQLLAEVAAGLRTGLSVEVDEPVIRAGQLVGGTLTHVGFVTDPAFPDARLAAAVAADVGDVAAVDTGQPATVDTPTATVTVTVETPEGEQPVEPDTVPATPDAAPVAAAAPAAPVATAPAAAPATLAAAAAGRQSGATLTAESIGDLPTFVRMLAGAHSRQDRRMLAELADITQTAIGVDVDAPQFVQELWSGVAYERSVVPLLTNAPLTSYKVDGWRWVTKPEVDDYAGDKADVPSNQPDTEPEQVTAQRLAGAHNLDRKFVDFGDTGFLDSYLRAMTESYARKSDAKALAALVAGGTLVSGGTVPTGISAAAAALVDGALAVIDKGLPSFGIVSKSLYRDLLLTPRDQVLELLSMALGLQEGSLGGFRLIPRSDLADGDVIVGIKGAATWYELGGGSPIRVDALDIAKGGVDTGVFGYFATIINDPEGIAVVEAATTSIDVTPATKTLAVAATQQLVVIATFPDGSTADVTAEATYVSGTPAKATVNAAGLITAVASGTSTVTATYHGKTDTCAVTVS